MFAELLHVALPSRSFMMIPAKRCSALLLSVLAVATTAKSPTSCKCTPLDNCWPSPETWDNLNIALNGALLHPLPPASICYPASPNYSPDACSALLSTWHLSTTHLNHPLSIDYPFWSDPLACPPIFPNGTSLAGDPLAGERGCSRGGYPEYVVNATQESHISDALKFAEEHNVRVVVKNTGHNHLGRSTGFGSLSIWTHNLRGIEWHDEWTSGCEEDEGGQMAITIGAGEVVGDVIRAAAEHKAIVVTGANPSVGVVGWATGGGHGYLSQTYGFGSDNILSATLVTASGESLLVKACSHPDLFWAIRGGGGGTFGVITSLTFKAFPSPQTTSWDIQATLTNDDEDSFWDLMVDFHGMLAEFKRSGLQGYYYILGTPMMSSLYFGLKFMAFNQPEGAVEAVTQPFRQKLEELKRTMQWEEQIERFNSFVEAYNGDVANEPVGTGGMSLGSRLLPEEALRDRKKLKEAMRAVGPSLDPKHTDAPPIIIGHAIANDNTNVNTSLNPAWRSTLTHFLFARGWPDSTSADEVAAVRNDVTNTKMEYLRDLAPESGSYYNEMDAFEPEWQDVTWGHKYASLVAVKERVDPDGLFWCRHCVGSEAWEEDASGRLCRPSTREGDGNQSSKAIHDEL